MYTISEPLLVGSIPGKAVQVERAKREQFPFLQCFCTIHTYNLWEFSCLLFGKGRTCALFTLSLFPQFNCSPLTQGEKRGHSQNIQRNKQKLNLIFGLVSAHLGLGDLRDF